MKRKIGLLLSILLLLVSASAQTVRVDGGTYLSVYDLGLQCPRQVMWMLRSADLGDASRNPAWRFDADIEDTLAVARHDDFKGSGFHRGHMCPAADRSSSLVAMRSTFKMSNVAPQMPAVNVGTWKSTETFCRSAAKTYDSVCVVAVPVFLDRDTVRLRRGRIAVPHAFFKAVWLPATDSVLNAWFIFNE